MQQVTKFVLLAGISAAFALGHGSASAQQPTSPESRQALKAAMLDEAYSAAKYKLFAEHARRAGKKKLADLMAETANMEYGHFLRWAELYRLVGTDVQNVRASVQDEIDDDIKLYERLASEAEARGDKALAEHFQQVKAQEEKEQNSFTAAVENALKSD